MHIVKEQIEGNLEIFHITYEWDGSNTVTVVEAEQNVGYSWPVPKWEPTRVSERPFSELPERIQQALLKAQETNQPVDLGKS